MIMQIAKKNKFQSSWKSWTHQSLHHWTHSWDRSAGAKVSGSSWYRDPPHVLGVVPNTPYACWNLFLPYLHSYSPFAYFTLYTCIRHTCCHSPNSKFWWCKPGAHAAPTTDPIVSLLIVWKTCSPSVLDNIFVTIIWKSFFIQFTLIDPL